MLRALVATAREWAPAVVAAGTTIAIGIVAFEATAAVNAAVSLAPPTTSTDTGAAGTAAASTSTCAASTSGAGTSAETSADVSTGTSAETSTSTSTSTNQAQVPNAQAEARAQAQGKFVTWPLRLWRNRPRHTNEEEAALWGALRAANTFVVVGGSTAALATCLGRGAWHKASALSCQTATVYGATLALVLVAQGTIHLAAALSAPEPAADPIVYAGVPASIQLSCIAVTAIHALFQTRDLL